MIVEEAQFFTTGIVDFCVTAAEADKNGVCVRARWHANRHPFGDLHRPCAVADTFVKCTALCQLCADGTAAPFTAATQELPQAAFWWGREIYMALCRKHYVKGMTS